MQIQNKIISIAIVLSTGLLLDCAFIQKNIKDPALNLYRRGSCFSIDIPPITLTPARTAAERQLIGDDREIEKDGWLVASARSTTRSDGTVSVEETKRVYREYAVLEFYEEPLRDYARAGILGESRDDGMVYLVPERIVPRVGRFRNLEEIEAARRVSEEINRSRSFLIQRANSKTEDQSQSHDKEARAQFLRQIRPGEWVLDKGNWVKEK